MTAALSRKEMRVVLDSLRSQGVPLVKTKDGYRVLFPNGATTAIHRTPSDHRSTANLRGAIRRAGFSWPFDHKRKEPSMATRYTKAEHKKFDATVKLLAPGPVVASALAAELEVSIPTAKAVLGRMGFVPESRGVWQVPAEPVDAYPEIARMEAREAARAELVVVEPEPVVEPVVEPERPAERAFADDFDSWTLPVPKKLQAKADEMGLHIEVRVWRQPVD